MRRLVDTELVQVRGGIARLSGTSGIDLWQPDFGQRVFRSPGLSDANSTLNLVSAQAYFTFLAFVSKPVVPKFVELNLNGLAVAVTAAEVGLFSSPVAPNKAGQTLTKIVATNAMDSLTVGTGVKRNTAAFSQQVDAGTYLWAGIQVTWTTTAPNFMALSTDLSEGHGLLTAAAASFTTAGPWTGALIAAGGIGLQIRATLD